jgi:hypothetical protein
MDRRTALRLGGGLGLVAAGGLVARAVDQGLVFSGDGAGLSAWNDWNQGRYSGPLALVSAAVLAGSPHNSQPWHFALGRLGIDIFDMPGRNLGAMDPFGRERLAGLGAAIQNMALASTGLARSAAVELLPDAAYPDHVARLQLGPDDASVAPHPLIAAIGRRHTDRGPWTGAPIGAAEIAALAAASRSPDVRIMLFGAASARGRRFAALTMDATAAIAGDAAMMAASHAWFRHSQRDLDTLRDGLSLRTAGVSPLLATVGAMLPEQSAAAEGRYWLAATRETALPTASAFGLIMVRDPWDRRSALLAGMTWQRLHLIAAAAGLAAQPLNQLPEMIDRERALGGAGRFAASVDALLPDRAWRPTFAFRVGHSKRPAPASVRRPVSEVIGAPARLDFDVARAKAETEAQDRATAGK